MGDNLIATSTTDSVDEMRAAFGLPPEPPKPAVEATAPATGDGESDTGDEGDVADDTTQAEPPAQTEPPADGAHRLEVKPQPQQTERQQYRPAKARIAQLTAQKAEADQRAETLAADNARLRAELEAARKPPAAAPPQQPAATEPPTAAVPPPAPPAAVEPPAAPPVVAAADDPEPKEEDFEELGYAEFMKKLTAWQTRQTIREERERERAATEARAREQEVARIQREHNERQQRILAEYNEKAKSARERHADFDQVLEANGNLMVPITALQYMQESPLGAELQYYLATHADEAAAINTKHSKGDVLGAFADVCAIEARIKAEIAEPPKPPKIPAVPVSQAPAPLSRVGSGTVVPPVDLDKVTSQAEYNRIRDQQEADARRRSA